jgi:hypothetical protein
MLIRENYFLRPMATKSNVAQHGGAHSKKYENEIKSDAGS